MKPVKVKIRTEVDPGCIHVDQGQYLQVSVLREDGKFITMEILVDDVGKVHLHADERLVFKQWAGKA